MGRVVRIAWGRTYNTGNFTSYRVDVEYALEEGEATYETMRSLGRQVHEMATTILREQGVQSIVEPYGVVKLEPPAEDSESEFVDEIPF